MIFLLCLCFASTGVLAQVNEESVDPTFGKTWTFYPDEDGQLQIIHLNDPNEQNSRASINEIRSKVHFDFYRKSNSRSPKEIDWDSNDEVLKNFDSSLETKFIIHGWKSNGNSPIIQEIKDEYLERADLNIIGVNWQDIASNDLYVPSAQQTQQVGEIVAELIDRLVDRGANLSNIHLIGHSLGAHTCGYAGSMVKSGKVSRISGLDPALPYFQLRSVNHRLDPTDAEFVDVIHTSAGLAGYVGSLGHVDFYPNRGIHPQPGCTQVSCSHSRSYEFFAESIRSEVGFYSYPCGSYDLFTEGKCKNDSILMGDKTPSTARGDYYLKTGSERGTFAQGPLE